MKNPKESRSETGSPPIVRCPIHGIAYDVELEECPECAKARGLAQDP